MGVRLLICQALWCAVVCNVCLGCKHRAVKGHQDSSSLLQCLDCRIRHVCHLQTDFSATQKHSCMATSGTHSMAFFQRIKSIRQLHATDLVAEAWELPAKGAGQANPDPAEIETPVNVDFA